ncbi:MAG: hypothetical protein JNK48_05325 [Bryobacterales bacterium]|nr:hypothetical protein [Bryobacterales bacterium]
MSYLDNLENQLKSLERQEERDPARIQEERDRAARERNSRKAAGPYAEQLRSGKFTQDLLAHATRLGFAKRAKVHLSWIDTTLRLEAKQLRLELKPTGEGVVAHFLDGGQETGTERVDLNGDAASLAEKWIAGL